MTVARRNIVDPSVTPYYHCIARCVRRAYLCGDDHLTKKNFNHRKKWLVYRMMALSQIFSIDICAYAVLSNHFHVVLHVDTEQSQNWSLTDVTRRWCRLFKSPVGVRFLSGECLTEQEQREFAEKTEIWRTRLADVSWFMRCLNEYIARKANIEDECTGRFWEGRFRCQALMDDTSVLSCMAYVDLNPVRAGLASSLEESDFTSIQERIAASQDISAASNPAPDIRLMPFQDSPVSSASGHRVPCHFSDYLALVDWYGRIGRSDKRGVIPAHVPGILQTLGLDEEGRRKHLRKFRPRARLLVSAVN